MLVEQAIHTTHRTNGFISLQTITTGPIFACFGPNLWLRTAKADCVPATPAVTCAAGAESIPVTCSSRLEGKVEGDYLGEFPAAIAHRRNPLAPPCRNLTRVLSVSLRMEASWHREFLRDKTIWARYGSSVSVIRSLEPIQHMPPQRVSFRQEGMIEVVGRIVRHAQFFHDPA